MPIRQALIFIANLRGCLLKENHITWQSPQSPENSLDLSGVWKLAISTTDHQSAIEPEDSNNKDDSKKYQGLKRHDIVAGSNKRQNSTVWLFTSVLFWYRLALGMAIFRDKEFVIHDYRLDSKAFDGTINLG